MLTGNTKSFGGIPCSRGIGIGKAVRINDPDYDLFSDVIEPDREISRLEEAIVRYKDINEKNASEVEKSLGRNEADIIRSQSVIVDDPELLSLLYKFIRSGKSAEKSVLEVCNLFSSMFSSSDDPMINNKNSDINDVRDYLIKILSGEDIRCSGYDKDSVIIAHNMVPSVISGLKEGKVAGIVSEEGNENSHSSILARAIGIPMVSGVSGICDIVGEGSDIIVDGLDGEVILEADEKTKSYYIGKNRDFIEFMSELEVYKGRKCMLPDGREFKIFCNITGIGNIRKVAIGDCKGVGLYRTEFLFMNSTSMPGEEEQYKVYKRIAEGLSEKSVTIRILDIGGDKDIPYLNLPKEDNPFLGIRGIRYLLNERKILKTQLRAIYRAAVHGDIRIMVPMITDRIELVKFKNIVKEVKDDLTAEGIPHKEEISIGCMIETPSAAITAETIAQEADFFSIGTNDLIQYTMCADRGNSRVSYLYSAYYPAVIRMIGLVADAAKKASIPVYVCGEAASDEHLLPVLIGAGISGISVEPDYVLALKQAFLKLDIQKCGDIYENVLKLLAEEEIAGYLQSIQ